MTTLNWKSTVMWTALSLLFLLLALMVGPAPALADQLAKGVSPGTGLVLYEVTEDMYLCANDGCTEFTSDVTKAIRRQAVAQLSGLAKLGTPLCPWEVLVVAPGAKVCSVNASGGDNLSLADGKGSVSGTFAVTVQDPNKVDAPEFVAMTGTFTGKADLSLPFASIAPIGFISDGEGVVDQTGETFTFTGTFRLPFSTGANGAHAKPRREKNAFYLADDFQTLLPVQAGEKSLGWPTVRLEIGF